MEIVRTLVSPVVLAGTLRMSTPIILGAMGGCFINNVGIFFIAYESLMLTAAFFATLGSYITGNAFVGTLFAICSSLIMGILFGIFVLHGNANPLIVGIALNFGAWAITTQLLLTIFKVRGAFISSAVISYRQINIPVLSRLGFINEVFNNKIFLVYFACLMVFVCHVIIYQTPFGLRIRGAGMNPIASKSSGADLVRYKWTTILIMSVFVGIAGSYLPLSGVSMFSENMTSGRGFLCMAAVLVGQGNPLKTGLIALLFGYTDALYLTLTSFELPTQLLSCIPFLAVIVVLVISRLKNFHGKADIKF